MLICGLGPLVPPGRSRHAFVPGAHLADRRRDKRISYRGSQGIETGVFMRVLIASVDFFTAASIKRTLAKEKVMYDTRPR